MVDVVTALEWVHTNVEMPAVVLMSLGGPMVTILDAAAQSVTDAGITVVVAGGNSAAGDAYLLEVNVHGKDWSDVNQVCLQSDQRGLCLSAYCQSCKW